MNKKCNWCQEIKPIEEFRKGAVCNGCNKILNKAYRDKNKDKRKKYYEDNKARELMNNKIYIEKNKDKVKDAHKKWYEKNKEIIRVKARSRQSTLEGRFTMWKNGAKKEKLIGT